MTARAKVIIFASLVVFMIKQGRGFLRRFKAVRQAITAQKAVKTAGSKMAKSMRLWMRQATTAQKRAAIVILF